MITLSSADLARVKDLTERCYPHLHPVVRAYLNEQLLEASAYWEFTDWCERVELTIQFYEGKEPHGLGGPVKTKRRSSKPLA